jgi:uncharacterized protein
MLYSIISNDVKNSLPLRVKARPAHISRLKDLQNQGRLILAGPSPAIDTNEPGDAGFTGSVVIAEFDSLEQAQSWAKEDPYMIGGVYENVMVKPFKKVFP